MFSRREYLFQSDARDTDLRVELEARSSTTPSRPLPIPPKKKPLPVPPTSKEELPITPKSRQLPIPPITPPKEELPIPPKKRLPSIPIGDTTPHLGQPVRRATSPLLPAKDSESRPLPNIPESETTPLSSSHVLLEPSSQSSDRTFDRKKFANNVDIFGGQLKVPTKLKHWNLKGINLKDGMVYLPLPTRTRSV